MPYYEELSLASSESDEGDDESQTGLDEWQGSSQEDLWGRCILHLDVDCFYCQCEEIEGPPEYKDRPIAIGQKHIIVTSNYVARKEGVQKLQLRSEAIRACPNLLIIEGSDLERYRKHSRNIYQAVRDSLNMLTNEFSLDHHIPMRKGGMDEVFVDLTALVDEARKPGTSATLQPSFFVYGDSQSDHKSSVTEDQTGAQVFVSHESNKRVSSSENAHVDYASSSCRQVCMERLHIAASLSERLRCYVSEKTGFITSMGISVSPMLAKLASDLKKPNSLNILYPWRSSSVLLPMPLRKVPELGHRTLKTLRECLERLHAKQPAFWTCRDLLQVPRHEIIRCLEQVKSLESNSEEHCDMLLQKCRGVDLTKIEDDNGGVTKTVSVENSFRRGSVRTVQAVWDAMEELFVRLPRLLDERRLYSDCPKRSYPTTIRLTARIVANSTQERRPFLTRSKQCSFDGNSLMVESNVAKRSTLLRVPVAPLLDALVFSGQASEGINVTRLNIAVTNFQDLVPVSLIPSISQGHGDVSIAQLLRTSSNLSTPNLQNPESGKKRPLSFSDIAVTMPRNIQQQRQRITTLTHVQSSIGRSRNTSNTEHCIHFADIDHTVLAELPADIAAEVRQMYASAQVPKPKQNTLETFFARKR